MSDLVVAVVDAKTPGNIGTIARGMKNFGLSDLYLVDPPYLGRDSEAYGFAGHARDDVLPNAREVSFDYLVENFHTVGTTAVTNEDETKHMRWPFKTPVELRESLKSVDTDTALIFGREGVGLTNEELARVDEVVSIPANAAYPVLNLGQAATIVLYELRDLGVDEFQLPASVHERAPEDEIEGFYGHFADFLEFINYPVEKRSKTQRMLRRLLGRAHPTGREIATLHGILRRARQRAEHPERADD
ncbi:MULTISPECIES: RNA methyltransferase [unclassified Haladaptatus]|uniref:RNA methyltransferase n=1 Tax=unclassified Haladaptatus TaxID=2622732 RepID=UPI0023E80F82|nr:MULTISPECIES: RNA methyltransferase [unclassified Haladaptatus]